MWRNETQELMKEIKELSESYRFLVLSSFTRSGAGSFFWKPSGRRQYSCRWQDRRLKNVSSNHVKGEISGTFGM